MSKITRSCFGCGIVDYKRGVKRKNCPFPDDELIGGVVKKADLWRDGWDVCKNNKKMANTFYKQVDSSLIPNEGL